MYVDIVSHINLTILNIWSNSKSEAGCWAKRPRFSCCSTGWYITSIQVLFLLCFLVAIICQKIRKGLVGWAIPLVCLIKSFFFTFKLRATWRPYKMEWCQWSILYYQDSCLSAWYLYYHASAFAICSLIYQIYLFFHSLPFLMFF